MIGSFMCIARAQEIHIYNTFCAFLHIKRGRCEYRNVPKPIFKYPFKGYKTKKCFGVLCAHLYYCSAGKHQKRCM